MFENNNRKVIKDVSVLPTTGETRFIYHNITNGYNYLWNEVEGIFIKVEQSTANFASIVYVNTTTPTTATIFDDVNPPVVNDNSLKSNPSNLYIASDGSTWTFKTSTSTYSTYTVPQSTSFYLAGTTTDAGSNKTSSIYRVGSLGVGQSNPSAKLDVISTTTDVARFATSLSSTNYAGVGIGNGVGVWAKLASGEGKFQIRNFSTDAIFFNTDLGTGNVGIGLSSVIAKFAVNDSAYISALPTTTANLQDNTTFRPHTRFQTTSGVNNNALSLYSTAAAFAIQSHNYSTGATLPLNLQTAGGSVGIGTTTPYSQLANTASTIQGSIISSVNGGFNWVSPGAGFAHSVFSSNLNGGGAQVKVAGNTSNVYAFEVSQATTQTGITTPLFNVIGNGNVGVGTASPLNKLTVKGLNNQPSALGTNQTNAILRVEGESNHSLDFGTYASSPWGSYIQSHNKTGTTPLPLNLNPSGGNVGIGTNTPNSALEVAGSFGAAIRSSATSLTTLSTDYTIIMTAATTVVTLETPSTTTNRRILNIKNGSTGNVTITGNIDGTTQTLTLTQKESRTFHSNGSTWWVI